VLTQIKTNKAILQMPNGETIAYPSLSSHPNQKRDELSGRTFLEASDGTGHISVFMRETGAQWLEGYQLRYIYFIDKSYRDRLTVDEIPFSEIDRIGAGMYKGEKVSVAERQEQARR